MRCAGGAGLLVHNTQDGLTINFNEDYRGGVTVVGNLVVTGDIFAGPVSSVSGAISALQSALTALENRVAQLTELIGAVVIQNWRMKNEVELDDDMGIVALSAEQLGLVAAYQIDQHNPNFQHEDVISITPPAGTLVSRGSTVNDRSLGDSAPRDARLARATPSMGATDRVSTPAEGSRGDR